MVLEPIRNIAIYSIMSDEWTDIASLEQFSVCTGTVDDVLKVFSIMVDEWTDIANFEPFGVLYEIPNIAI